MLTECLSALRGILPPYAQVGGAGTGDDHPLLAGEAIPRARPERLREFAAGRHAARLALGRDVPIPRGTDLAPVWPCGWIGSITHCKMIALAAVLPSGRSKAIGIDMEDDSSIAPDVARIVAGVNDGHPAKAIFVAKEAAYKAQFALSGAAMNYEGFCVSLAGDRFEARFTAETGPFAAGAVLHGRMSFGAGFVIAAVVI